MVTRRMAILTPVTLVLVIAGIIVLVLLLPPSTPQPHDQEITISDPDFHSAVVPEEGNTQIFTKYVTENTTYILVDLNSGDTDDPISLSIITPDRVLGPFTDSSDGAIDGRIYLRIDRPGNLTQGRWEFVVHSTKTIEIGSAGDEPWNNTGILQPQT
ncbi:MAG: hypothetical protein WC342_06360 [Methanoregula sp.]